MSALSTLRSSAPVIGVSVSMGIIYVSVLSIPLAAGQTLGLSPDELASWVMSIYGIPGALGIWLALRYHQPLAITGTLIAIVLVASTGTRLAYSDMAGAFVVAGALLLILGYFGLTSRLSKWIPTEIVIAVLAGAVLPFVIRIFDPLANNLLLIGSSVLAFLIARRLLGPQPISILPALVTGITLAAATGNVGQLPTSGALPGITVTVPTFSIQAIATITPVVIVLMTLQANIPSLVVMRSNGYEPPDRTVDLTSGFGTIFASFFGPVAVSLSLPAVSLVSSPDAGEPEQRHRAVYLANGWSVVIAAFAGAAAALAAIIPLALLLALAGLAMIGVLTGALRQMLSGKLTLAPVLAFAIALSDLEMFGFGPIFWALAVGIVVSHLVERE